MGRTARTARASAARAAASERAARLHRRRRHGRLGALRRLVSGTDGDTEFALGETRWDDGSFIGTFLAVAHLDADGRMRPLHGRRARPRSPSRPARAMRALSSPSPRPTPAREPVLLGSECRALRHRDLPAPGLLPALHVDGRRERLLARRGTLWTWTIQRFRPKSPPYAGDGGGVRALRRRLRRAARRGARRGAPDRVRSRAAARSAWRWS